MTKMVIVGGFILNSKNFNRILSRSHNLFYLLCVYKTSA